MKHDHQTNGKVRVLSVPCPICGEPLQFGLLEITEEDGEVVKLLTYDCPRGDYHGALKEAEVRQMAAREVVRRVRLLESDP